METQHSIKCLCLWSQSCFKMISFYGFMLWLLCWLKNPFELNKNEIGEMCESLRRKSNLACVCARPTEWSLLAMQKQCKRCRVHKGCNNFCVTSAWTDVLDSMCVSMSKVVGNRKIIPIVKVLIVSTSEASDLQRTLQKRYGSCYPIALFGANWFHLL